jgi:hypothetical protein
VPPTLQVFDGGLPAVPLVWNPRLTSTAGQVVDDGSQNRLKASREERVPVRLELSTKVRQHSLGCSSLEDGVCAYCWKRMLCLHMLVSVVGYSACWETCKLSSGEGVMTVHAQSRRPGQAVSVQ